MDPTPSRQAKDHVFVDMFNQPKYCLELFRAIHPEATDITIEDISNITVTHVVVDKPYNDLGFTVRDKQIILVEAQAKWSMNILFRLLAYLIDSYLRYMKRKGFDVHDTAIIRLPEPEFYVIYTGENKSVPDEISFRKDFFKNINAKLDLEAKVIKSENTDDIIGQYIIFCHVYDQQRKLYGADIKAVQETIRICKERGALKEYLEAHEEEVLTIMMNIFKQEEAVEMYGNRREKEGKVKALAELIDDGTLTLEKAAIKAGMTVQEFQEAVENLKVTA